MELSLIHNKNVTKVVYNDNEVICHDIEQGLDFYQFMYKSIKERKYLDSKD